MQLDLIVVGSSSAPSECGELYKAKELTVALDPDAFDMSVLFLFSFSKTWLVAP